MTTGGLCLLLASALPPAMTSGETADIALNSPVRCDDVMRATELHRRSGWHPDLRRWTKRLHGPHPRFRHNGIDFAASYGFETATNVAGGDKARIANAGQLVLGATVDADRLISGLGGTFRATATYRHGTDLGAVAGLGTLQQVQEVYGRGQTWRLTQFWYARVFAGGKLDVKLGRLTQGEDFGDFSCSFMNLTFCGMPAGNLAGDYWFNWPISQWGARLRINSGSFYVMAGAYEDNPRNLRKSFTIGRFHGATGILIPAEIGYLSRLGPGALPGTYKLGAWYSSSDADDVRHDTGGQQGAAGAGSPLRRGGRHGVYLQIQQQLSGIAGNGPEGRATVRGLVAFLNITQTDRQTTATDNQVAAGLFYIGVLASRPLDQLGIAVGRTNVNGRARWLTIGSDGRRREAEYAIEVDYAIHASHWLTIRPNVQYIVYPGGDRRAPNVVVLGLKGAITI